MKAFACLLLVAIMAAFLEAQNPPASFEVASIKQNQGRPSSPADRALGCQGTDSRSPGTTIPLGRCIARFETLRMVVAFAYDIPPSLMYPYDGAILSGPKWLDSEIYNIDAKAEMPATHAQLKQMLQALLADRFKLKVHRETREMPVYGLVAKNGVKFPPAPKDRDCANQLRRDHRYELGAAVLTGHCHAFVPGGADAMILGQSVEMSDLAEMLSIWAGRIVVDKTGVTGLYDVKLPRFSIQTAPPVSEIPTDPARAKALEAQLALPTLANVLDQFGLKLESTKAPIEVIVIDSIEKPSEN